MRVRFLRGMLLLLAAAMPMAWAGAARAVITCTGVSMADLSFGEVNPLGAAKTAQSTLRYSCSNDNADATPNSSAMLCFSLRVENPYMKAQGSSRLHFNIYQDAALTVLWGSQYGGAQNGGPLMVPITLPAGAVDVPFYAPVYAIVPEGQISAEPGLYTANYQAGDTNMTLESVAGDTPPAACGNKKDEKFPFQVGAFVSPQCVVTAGRRLDFGGVPSGARNTTGSTTVSVTCTLNTAYNIGLSPSNGSVTGSGMMSGKRSGNTDKVPYQLTSSVGPNGTPWGNLASATNAGNGVSGSGTGTAELYPVYATVPDATYAPDTYSDTVTVMVYY